MSDRVALVYDVGMNNGDDTAHYLTRAERVVAIEANPQLVDAARERFRDQIAAGRLELLNLGIADQSAELEFWINEKFSEWSSFGKDIAGREGHPLRAVRVAAEPLDVVIAQYGLPDYMKIDIEGYDRHCLAALEPARKPRWISIEFNHPELIEPLQELGYTRFKVICQFTHRALALRLSDSFLELERRFNRATQLAADGRLLPRLRSRLLWMSVARRRKVLQNAAFPDGSSGPFGAATDGPWESPDAIAAVFEACQRHIAATGSGLPLWCDLHASA